MILNTIKEHLEKLEHAQREALLFVIAAYKKKISLRIVKEINLPSLEIRRKLSEIQFMYKPQNNLLQIT